MMTGALDPILGTWWPARLRAAALAVFTGALTAALVAAVGGVSASYGAGAYLFLVVAALFAPAAIAFQVVAGQILIVVTLVGDNGMPLPLAMAAVAGVVLTAELLAAVARLDSPLECRLRKDLVRGLAAGVLGAGSFGIVALVLRWPGPGGLLAVAVASGACVLLALVLGRRS